MKLPFPIDHVKYYNTENIQSIVVGNDLQVEKPIIWTAEHGDNQTFISGDDNLFLPYIVIHYRIKNAHQYYLNYQQGAPEKLLYSITLQLLNHTFSQKSFYDLILTDRKNWTSDVSQRLQNEINKLQIGIEIVYLSLRDIHPPVSIASNYEEIVAAHQMKTATLNIVEREAIIKLSKSRIYNMQTIMNADKYAIDKIKKTEGEAENYLLRNQIYTREKRQMKEILTLMSAKNILSDKKIYLIDPKSGINEDYLYIEEYLTGTIQ